MTPFVVDASSAVKWVLPEPGADVAARLRGPGYVLHAPELLLVEVANIFWKAERRGDLTAADAADGLDIIRSGIPYLYPDAGLSSAALAIALSTGRAVYDSLYVALAVRLGAEVVTADDRLVNALRGTPWQRFVRRLTDLP